MHTSYLSFSICLGTVYCQLESVTRAVRSSTPLWNEAFVSSVEKVDQFHVVRVDTVDKTTRNNERVVSLLGHGSNYDEFVPPYSTVFTATKVKSFAVGGRY